ncbi:MAG TPA: hypothetical protein VKB80_24155 [Kofleriaceae bacterium]|nr:hypothetical protein [Kofleriaceae bacterium]
MGLFDKKKKGRDEFDSPVEHVDLSAAAAAAIDDEAGTDPDDAETVERASAPVKTAVPGSRTGEGRRARTNPGTYGIDDAIALMRTLPSENVELVVQVVKHTLESARIDIGVIIDDATAKQQRIDARVSVLRDAIGELEREIDTRRAEIDQLETDNRETTRVKERLVLAEKLSQGARPDTVVEAHASRGRVEAPAAPQRARPSTPPPPPSSSSSSSGPAPSGGNPNHVGSGNHIVPGPVGPGGPVVGSSPVGPGGPAGSYSHKPSSTHTVIPKK